MKDNQMMMDAVLKLTAHLPDEGQHALTQHDIVYVSRFHPSPCSLSR
jgi:hypothetical protein